jgi:hypothetical protein
MDRLTVTAGDPTPEEIAAVVAVVAGIESTAAPAPTGPSIPRWGRAARIEAIGERPLVGATDPRLSART